MFLIRLIIIENHNLKVKGDKCIFSNHSFFYSKSGEAQRNSHLHGNKLFFHTLIYFYHFAIDIAVFDDIHGYCIMKRKAIFQIRTEKQP